MLTRDSNLRCTALTTTRTIHCFTWTWVINIRLIAIFHENSCFVFNKFVSAFSKPKFSEVEIFHRPFNISTCISILSVRSTTPKLKFYVRLSSKIFYKCEVKYGLDGDSFRGKREKKVFKHLLK